MLRRIALLTAASTFATVPATALADDSVIVLGFQSMEGDDDFALSLTGALRHAATQVGGWNVSEREVSLDQMTLAEGCDETDADCLGRIAQTLSADLVIFGTVSRSAPGGDFDFDVTIQIYEARGARIAQSITDRIPRIRSDIDHLRGRVRRYVSQLGGQVASGSLVVAANVENAEVFVDGESLGFIEDGELRSNLPAGEHEIEVHADDHETFRRSVNVQSGSENRMEARLVSGEGDTLPGPGDERAGGISRSTLGWAAIGVGGAGFLMSIISWLALDGIGQLGVGLDLDLISDDATVTAYRSTIRPASGVGTVQDFCAEANKGRTSGAFDGRLEDVQSSCSSASLFTALWWTGLVVGVLGTGAGLYLVLTDDGDEEPSPAGSSPRVALRPILGRYVTGLTATLQL